MTGIHRQHALFSLRESRRPCTRRVLFLPLAAVTIAWVFSGALDLNAQRAKPGEYQVKAAYLYNFGRFIAWPARATAARDDSFTICVLGQDPFGPALNATLAHETIDGKNVVAKRIPSPQDAVNCRILFISTSESERLKQILTSLADTSVLTVSDLPEFLRRGGMVQFAMEGDRVRFEVNLAPAEHAGLTVSSELLRVAINVRRNAQLGD